MEVGSVDRVVTQAARRESLENSVEAGFADRPWRELLFRFQFARAHE
jgi:hypothetical protein